MSCSRGQNGYNRYGISKFFSAKGEGMLPGDIVWNFIKRAGRKLKYEEGYVIEDGRMNSQCKDCKFYLYSGNCLLIKGKFRPGMELWIYCEDWEWN